MTLRPSLTCCLCRTGTTSSSWETTSQADVSLGRPCCILLYLSWTAARRCLLCPAPAVSDAQSVLADKILSKMGEGEPWLLPDLVLRSGWALPC